MTRCHIVQTAAGPVRVAGDVDPELLELLVQRVLALRAATCRHVGPHAMPPIAQRMHGRETYWCELPTGHEGQHRWARWTWDQS